MGSVAIHVYIHCSCVTNWYSVHVNNDIFWHIVDIVYSKGIYHCLGQDLIPWNHPWNSTSAVKASISKHGRLLSRSGGDFCTRKTLSFQPQWQGKGYLDCHHVVECSVYIGEAIAAGLAIPGLYLVYKYHQYKEEKERMRERRKITERDLQALNRKIVSTGTQCQC